MIEPPAAKPVDRVIARVFHFAIFVPFLKLDERLSKPYAIDPNHNDVSLMAADICVSCFHLVEQVRDSDRRLAPRIMKFPDWQLISDIANTRKHYIRTKGRTVRLEGTLCWEMNEEGKFAFLETRVIAQVPKGDSVNVFDLLLAFLNYCITEAGINDGKTLVPAPRKTSDFHDATFVMITHETLTSEGMSISAVRRAADSSFTPVGNIKFPLPNLILDLPEEARFGRFRLHFNVDEIKRITDENNASAFIPH